ncbi:WYL domain-containing transcriptional regulator [Periweissella cryptocerci]|uniref:WYL domain-containing transcriptional regulator n=1 Tax=Periweissella cryptocerci TaxID=2506420 RepID=A0A4V1AIV7_9LACO|nr:WYL domain-containing protein [Periweissella cryptocerci]QBO36845.1 WYL domain-containing transcriptional regulator [Periweissella cryptocerci]
MAEKFDRINTMMRYMNNRQTFTLRELADEFHVSKRTALRDVQTIESLGMPLEAQVGNGGGYSVMRNQLLPAVQFTTDELKSLFLAFQATANQQLPYLQDRQRLLEKLLAIASQAQQDDLLLLKQLILFENTNPANPNLLELSDFATPMLRTLLELSLQYQQLDFSYTDNQQHATVRTILVLNFYFQNSHWYLAAYDYTRQAKRNFRVDRITEPVINWQRSMPKQAELQSLKHTSPSAPNLRLQLQSTAIQRFKRMHAPQFQLEYIDPFQNVAKFETSINLTNPQEISFISDWLLFLGDEVKPIEVPNIIRANIQQKMQRW